MRIAVFTNHFPGRVNTFFARDMRALIEAGFKIDVFPFYPLDSTLWRYVPDILDDSVLSKDEVHHLGFVRSLASLRPWPLRKFGRFARDTLAITASAAPSGAVSLAKNFYVFPKAWAWSRNQIDRYDHVLSYWGNYSATCAYLFHRLMDGSVPFSMFLHAGIDLYWDHVYLKQKLLYADNVFVVCDFNRAYIAEHFPDIYPSVSGKIYKHHLGLDLASFPFKPDHRPARQLLAVGTFAKYKGYEFLLRAVAELNRRGVHCALQLVGEGSEGAALRSLTRQLSISDKVTFDGWLPPNQVRGAMQNATVFIHPSEGIGDAVPTVIKECMALGTPVVASNIAGIPELLDGGNCGVLVAPREPQAIANAIQSLVEQPSLRMKYAEAARKYAERTFDLWHNGQRLAQIISSSRRRVTQSDFSLLGKPGKVSGVRIK